MNADSSSSARRQEPTSITALFRAKRVHCARAHGQALISLHSVIPMPDHTLRLFQNISALLNSSLDHATIRTRAIEAATLLMHAEAGSLLLLDEATGGLYFDVAHGPIATFIAGETLCAKCVEPEVQCRPSHRPDTCSTNATVPVLTRVQSLRRSTWSSDPTTVCRSLPGGRRMILGLSPVERPVEWALL